MPHRACFIAPAACSPSSSVSLVVRHVSTPPAARSLSSARSAAAPHPLGLRRRAALPGRPGAFGERARRQDRRGYDDQRQQEQDDDDDGRRRAACAGARASSVLGADAAGDNKDDDNSSSSNNSNNIPGAEPVPPTLGMTVWNAYVKSADLFTNLFPIWTLAVAIAALRKPALFLWLTTPYFTLSLGILMLSMGITLTVEDFKRVLRRFNAVAIGFLGCYGLMPALAIALASIFKLPTDLAAGVILIGAVNGGQASNLCTYIANGNVALSVMMTTSTTLGAMIFTPLIAKLLLGAVVPVDALGMARSIIEVVLLPITTGMLLNKYCNRIVRAFLPFSPVLGVAATCLLVGSSVAQCAGPILAAGWSLVIPIVLLHVIGGIAGYYMQAAAGYGEIVRRTTAIETAMKSSAFGFLLASLHFGSYMVRVPSAVSVVVMALVGSTMSVIWRFIPVNAKLKFDRSLANRTGPFEKFLKPAASNEGGN